MHLLELAPQRPAGCVESRGDSSGADPERFADPDGRLPATFEFVWVSGWAPHESQQKPLRPGSAKARLADALGVPEVGTGEKAKR